MTKELDDLIESTRKALNESEQVEDGQHFNKRVGKGVPLPKHLKLKCDEAIKQGYVAHHHTTMGSKAASDHHHKASARSFEAAHALQEQGFERLARHFRALSHSHRRAAIS